MKLDAPLGKRVRVTTKDKKMFYGILTWIGKNGDIRIWKADTSQLIKGQDVINVDIAI